MLFKMIEKDEESPQIHTALLSWEQELQEDITRES